MSQMARLTRCCFFRALCILFLSAGVSEAFATKYTVTTNGDSGAGSLREQVQTAASGDTIIFDAATNGASITFLGSESLNKSLVITGNGVINTIIDGGHWDRMFYLDIGFTLHMSGLTLQNFGGDFLGGGVFLTRGTLTLTDCKFEGNEAITGGVATNDQGTIVVTNCYFNDNSAIDAGGVFYCYQGSLTLSNSTLSNNTIVGEDGYQHGGAIINFYGALSIDNCTFAGNQAGPVGRGGAIYNDSPLTLTITNSTFSANTSTLGGAIYNGYSALTINNTIIAGNTSALSPDAHNEGGSFTGTNDYNLIGDNTGFGMPAGSGNILGTDVSPVDAQLEALADNGAFTPTMALQCSSPALDAGNPASATPDQRGIAVYNTIKDIGAYESNGACEVTIAGAITTENAIPIAGVKVLLSGDKLATVVTAADGLYSFTVSIGDNITVTPSKSNDVNLNNGITTLDIYMIRKHVLGGTQLNSPYKIIAADANGTNNVNTADIPPIRLVILSNAVKFPPLNSRMWEFVSSYNSPTDPFPFFTIRTYSNIATNQTNQNFTAVKLGDVNNSWNPATP